MHSKSWLGISLLCLTLILNSGCEVLLLGGAATAGYKLSTDEKTVSESFDDSMVTSSVKTRLIEDRQVRALNIDVDTDLGEVTLSGYVRSREEVDRAVIIAKGTPGVEKVMSLLKVRALE
jgi:hyperosmotically inducible protein